MKYDSVLDQQSISGKIVSLILCVWKPCYVKSGHISTESPSCEEQHDTKRKALQQIMAELWPFIHHYMKKDDR